MRSRDKKTREEPPLVRKMPVVGSKYSNINANKATLVLGAPGTGKSWCVVRTEILQTLKRGGSLVATDPKGELHSSMAFLCHQMGYRVQVLNLIDSDRSHAWNVLMEVINHETGMLDPDRLANFAAVYIRNINPEQKQDFWQNGAKTVLMAFVGLRSYKHEKFVMETLLQAVERMLAEKNEMERWEALPESRKQTYSTTVNEVKDLFRETCRFFRISDVDIDNIIDAVEQEAPEVSLGAVYYDVLSMKAEGLNTMRREIEQIPFNHVAWTSFRTFDMEGIADNVRASTLQTMALNLAIFASEKRRKMLSNNDINLWETTTQKCAYFVIADKTEAIRPILSLFFNFLFDDCAYVWDRMDEKCKSIGEETLKYVKPVSVIMDEFYTIGYIPEFPQYLSTARSRHVDIMIILQFITQLQELYGEQGVSAIVGNCEYVLYLGCNEYETCKFISEFVAGGDTTVMSQTRTESVRGFSSPVKEITMSEAARPLITVGEVREYGGKNESIMVAKRATRPLDLKRFAYKEHPMSKALRDITIMETVKRPLSERYKRDIFRQKYEQEKLKIQFRDMVTVQYDLVQDVINILLSVKNDPDDFSSYEGLDDIGDYEDIGEDEYFFTVEDPDEETKKRLAEKKAKQEKKAGQPRRPKRGKNPPVVDSTFRHHAEPERRRRTPVKKEPDETPADSSELDDI